MPRPGSDVIQSTTPPVRQAPTDTGPWFVTGFTERGPLGPQTITSLAEYISIYGARITYGLLYDALDAFFRTSRGGRAIVSRVVGPNAVRSSVRLLDGARAVSLVATAKEYGVWGNRLRVEIGDGAGSTVNLLIYLDGVLVEEFTDVADQAAAVAVSELGEFIDFTTGAALDLPAVAAPVSLAGGGDDHDGATATEDADARALFSKDLGPGQVSAPGRTDDATHVDLLAHAASHNRIAIIDLPDVALASELKTAAATPVINQQYGAAFAPWVVIPGIVNGTTRTVPPSALVAGKIALTDRIAQINQPSAGLDFGVLGYALGLTQTFDDTTFQDLALNRVNVIRSIYNNITVFGWRSLVDAAVDDRWLNFGSSRLYMQIAALADQIALKHAFKLLDGGGLELGKLYKDLVGMLLPFHTAGSLFGDSPQEAFVVDLSGNTVTTMQDRELHAALGLKMSEFAEYVVINIVKTGLTESVV